MCDFHFNGNCFHPQKVQRGWVASSCDVHTCLDCTNTSWQNKIIKDEFMYQKELLNMITSPMNIDELQKPKMNNMFSFNFLKR